MIERLREYGLNRYEADAYVTLLEIGLSTSSKIAATSKVPYGKIYPVLSSLEGKGFVKIFSGRPKRFMAVNPEIALRETSNKRLDEAKKLQEATTKLITMLQGMSAKKEAPLEKVHIIQGYKNYLNISAELHSKAEKSWLTISRLPMHRELISAYKACVKRGVKVRILAAIPEYNKKNIGAWLRTGAQLRQVGFMPTRFSIKDGTDVIFRISGEDEANYIAIWIQNQSLAKSMADYFSSIWNKASDLGVLTQRKA